MVVNASPGMASRSTTPSAGGSLARLLPPGSRRAGAWQAARPFSATFWYQANNGAPTAPAHQHHVLDTGQGSQIGDAVANVQRKLVPIHFRRLCELGFSAQGSEATLV